jgi:DNA polymerase-3 subunit delta'
MSFSEIIGQQRIIRLLGQALTRGHMVHALLFTGMDGVGKRLTAMTLAKTLNCEHGINNDCCERCPSCRKMASGNHPDLLTIESEGQFIKIDQIRTLQQHLRFRPLEGRWRVVIICDAHNMKIEAANALLKVLEEPPSGNLFILAAPDTSALIPTIVSRCLHLRFQPLAAADIATHLHRVHAVDPARASVVAHLAGGSLSRALALVDERALVRRRWLLETLARVPQSSVSELLAAAEQWSTDKTDLKGDLEWLKIWTRDLLVCHLQRPVDAGLLNYDLTEDLAKTASCFRPDQLPELFDTLCALQRVGGQNLNKRLSLEALLLSLRVRTTDQRAERRPLLPAIQKEPYARASYG